MNLELDDDGYPTDSTLDQISAFSGDHHDLLEQVAFLFEEYGHCQYDKEKLMWDISTGGWSGCESVIEALGKNAWFWGCCWFMSKRGGYYEFEIMGGDNKNDSA